MRTSDKVKALPFIPLCFFVPLVITLSFLMVGCAGEPKHPTWKNATGVEQNERLMWQAIQSNEWDNVERHLSPTFIGVTGNGQVFDRAGWLQHWKTAPVGEFSLGEAQVQPEGADMKVTYILQLQIAKSNMAGLRVVSVWQQMKSGWMLTTSSLTPILQ